MLAYRALQEERRNRFHSPDLLYQKLVVLQVDSISRGAFLNVISIKIALCQMLRRVDLS